MAEIPNYVEGEITGFVGDIVGVDIFGVAHVLTLLEKEELTGADIQYIAGLMERIRSRGGELEAAGSSAAGNFNGAEQLQELAKLWEENNYRILQYADLEGATDEN